MVGPASIMDHLAGCHRRSLLLQLTIARQRDIVCELPGHNSALGGRSRTRPESLLARTARKQIRLLAASRLLGRAPAVYVYNCMGHAHRRTGRYPPGRKTTGATYRA